jgi:5'-deoxynucleotidase YfbR-like HD superfamily hydrolase
LNVNKAVVMAVVHDYDETISMDFPLPLKNKLGKDLMSKIQEVIDLESSSDFNDLGLNLDSNKQEKINMSEEYQLMKICDYLELLIWTYNNKTKIKGDYQKVINSCKELVRTYPLHKHSITAVQLLESEPFEFTYQ